MAQVEEEAKVNIDTKTEKGDEEEEQGIAEQADKDKETNVTSDSNLPTASAPLDVSSLPEGYSVLVGEDGPQYVTGGQDGQA